MTLIARLAIAWLTVTLFLLFGESWLADLSSALRAALLFLWLFAVILWCAFGVVAEADHLAELPAALGGVLIALIVFTPEAITALRAALDNQLQRIDQPVLEGRLTPRAVLDKFAAPCR